MSTVTHAVPTYTLGQLVRYMLRLGTVGFGGPVALAGYMHRDLVERLGWISEEDYKAAFRGSAIKRTKHRGIVRNACIALGNAKFERGAASHRASRQM